MMGPMAEDQARMLSPLVLAYVGDAVHDLHVRTQLAQRGGKVKGLHRQATGQVCCQAQALALDRIEDLLSEAERDIVRRGRNSHAHHSPPKNADPGAYAKATGLEALLGYLYLTGQTQRLGLVFQAVDGLDPTGGEAHAIL